MVVIGWIIIGLFAAAFLFGVPYLISGGYDYGITLLGWILFTIAAAGLMFLLLLAVSLVSGG